MFECILNCVVPADVGDIQSRLLDHRPVINAEIRYFVREFEVVEVMMWHRGLHTVTMTMFLSPATHTHV